MNKPVNFRHLIALCLIFVINATLLSACDDWEIFFDMAEDWAVESAVLDGDGNINYANLGRKITDDAFDNFFGSGTEIQLESGSVVNDVRKADDLAQQGAVSGDVVYIEEAIHLRPNDWAYTEIRSAVYLAQGDLDLWTRSQSNSRNLVRQSIENGADCTVAMRNLYQHRVKALQQQLDFYPNNENLINQLAAAQESLAQPEYDCD